MLGRLYENQDCSAARALELIGERWSLLILRDAMFGGFTRFSQFQKSLGIATNILARRLEDFVATGLMERRQPKASGEQAEYLLTQEGPGAEAGHHRADRVGRQMGAARPGRLPQRARRRARRASTAERRR